MKKLLVLLCVIAIGLCICGCADSAEIKTEDSKTAVVINLPEDDTVNGYRANAKKSSDDNAIDADSVAVEGTVSITSGSSAAAKYCVNKNSGIFHTEDCGSVAKMKEENKAYYKSRDAAVNDGYTPCKRCNP